MAIVKRNTGQFPGCLSIMKTFSEAQEINNNKQLNGVTCSSDPNSDTSKSPFHEKHRRESIKIQIKQRTRETIKSHDIHLKTAKGNGPFVK